MKKFVSGIKHLGLSVLAVLALLHMFSFSSHAQLTPGEETFATSKGAVQAVIKACKNDDVAALLKIFGSDGKDVILSGDPTVDKDARAKFVKAAGEKTKLVADPSNQDKLILTIGKDNWPFPIPLVRANGQWFFDSSAGREEILARRVGSNELDAIEVCRGYVEAQFEYAQTHKVGGLPVYAQKIVSSPGTQDGLYWEPSKDAPECQIPKGLAQAAESMSADKREPYHGYFFRILTAQGANARGGALNYIVKDQMIGGFALVAWPAEYGVSGVQTFIVDHDGDVYENNLGPETARIASEMTDFNPDKSWHPVQSE